MIHETTTSTAIAKRMTGKVWLHCHVNTAFTVATKFSLLKDIIISLNQPCRNATGKSMAPYICFYRVWPNLTIPPIWFYHFNFHPKIYSPSPNLLPEFSNSPKLTTGIQGRPRLVKKFFWRAVRLWERGDSHFLRVSFRKQLWRYSKKWSKWLGLCWRWPFVCPYCPMSRMPSMVIQLWLMVIWWSKWQMPAGLALKEAWLECINKNQQLLPVLPQN